MKSCQINNSTNAPSIEQIKKNLAKFPLTKINWSIVKRKGYDYMKIPGYSGYLGGAKKNGAIIKETLTRLFELFFNLNNKYKKSKRFIRIVIMISSPNLFDSQVIIFFDKGIYDIWFKRNSKEQKWVKTKKNNRVLKEYNLNQYDRCKETHYKEKIYNNTIVEERDLWFYEL